MWRVFVLGLGIIAGAVPAFAQGILPNAETQFSDANGAPYASGKVYFYVPGTTTPSTTWQDQGLTTPNTNPVLLNAAGRAQIWGAGIYREVLYDQFGSLVWDQLTSVQNASVAAITSGTISGVSISSSSITSSPITQSTLYNGAGNFLATENFGATDASADVISVLGTNSVGDTTANPVEIAEKFGGSALSGSNAAFAALAWKTQSANDQRAEAIYGEVEDKVGGMGSFIEAARLQASLSPSSTLGSAYGAVLVGGGDSGVSFTYMIGAEAQVENQFADAPGIFNPLTFSAGFLATNGLGGSPFLSDAAFAANPFSAKPWRKGFYVPPGGTGPGTAVQDAAFQSDENTAYGLQLERSVPTFASIGLPNNSPIRGLNAAGSADYNLFYINTSNGLTLGGDTGLTGGIQLDNSIISMPLLPSSGSAIGSLCVKFGNVLYVKTSSGACL